jgi:hypothetical protein
MFVFAFLSAFNVLSPVSADDGEQAGLCFRWALVVEDRSGLNNSLIPGDDPIKLKPDARIKFYLEAVRDAYLYLLLEDSTGALFLLFPEPPAFFEKQHSQGAQYFLPAKDFGYAFTEEHGEESFTLVASSARLGRFEELLSTYLRNPSPKLKREVFDELKLIRLRHASAADPAEKPVPIAGEFRGNGCVEAVEVQAGEFYAKTFTISH